MASLLHETGATASEVEGRVDADLICPRCDAGPLMLLDGHIRAVPQEDGHAVLIEAASDSARIVLCGHCGFCGHSRYFPWIGTKPPRPAAAAS